MKSANESGGYGMLDRHAGDAGGAGGFRERIRKDPRNYIAQPIVALSRSPSFCDDSMQGRHVDLRPYILYGEKVTIIPGGLTRVALSAARWWLIPRKAAGAKTPGSWMTKRKRRSRSVAVAIPIPDLA